MQRAVVVDAVRTPTGKRSGKLDGYHPVDLAAIPLRALVERNDLDPGLVDDVIMGCVMQTGEQSLNVGRNAALAAGFPKTWSARPSTASADRASSRLISPPKGSWRARTTSPSRAASSR